MVGLNRYLADYIGPDHFARVGRIAIYGSAAILVLRTADFQVGRWRFDVRVTRPAPVRRQQRTVIALALGLAWLFARTYHAVNHHWFIVRHLFLFYLVCCLVIARAIEVYCRHIHFSGPE